MVLYSSSSLTEHGSATRSVLLSAHANQYRILYLYILYHAIIIMCIKCTDYCYYYLRLHKLITVCTCTNIGVQIQMLITKLSNSHVQLATLVRIMFIKILCVHISKTLHLIKHYGNTSTHLKPHNSQFKGIHFLLS